MLAAGVSGERANVTRLCHGVDTAKGLSDPSRGILVLCVHPEAHIISSRNNSVCEYPVGLPTPTTHRSTVPVTSNQHHQVVQPAFPPVFFLDVDIFRQGQLELPSPGVGVPMYVSDLLGGHEMVREMAASYFGNAYPWMPFISKTWSYKHLLSPLSPVHADSTLLLLSMQLINWMPSIGADPRTAAYSAAKRFFLELETAGTLSTRVIQAGLLIALYEMGHCIYPAAYLSIGVCSRHAVALGLDKDIKRCHISGLPWDKVEERRRVWWAILILDR
jgi:hypothetical protein